MVSWMKGMHIQSESSIHFIEDHKVGCFPAQSVRKEDDKCFAGLIVIFSRSWRRDKCPGLTRLVIPSAREVSRPMIPLGAFGDRLFFFFFTVWCMVGSNEIDGSVCKSPDDRLAILFGTKRRVHFGKGAVLKNGIFRQCKMMRCGFGVKLLRPFFYKYGPDQRRCRS